MKVLVTGGAGFVGHNLAVALIKAGYNVVIYDNFSRLGEGRLDQIKDNVKIVRGDIRDFSQLMNGVPDCDFVVHLAAISRVDESLISPITTFEVNVIGTLNILEYCRKLHSKLIFASSWMVYDPEEAAKKKPLTEDARVGPITMYGLSKLVGEQYCRLYHLLYNVRSLILRFSNVYGPGDKDRLVPVLISRAKKGDDIHIFGRKQTLNYVYVSDVVKAICSAILTDIDFGIFNIGTSSSINLVKLASMIVSLCNSKSRIIEDPPRPFDYEYFCPDITKARKYLNYEPSVSLEEGLKECVRHYS
jgi:UDP-glucose 4-epimerase